MLLDKCCGLDIIINKDLLTRLYEPIVDFLSLVISASKVRERDVGSLSESGVFFIYHLVVKLHEMVITKCEKNGIMIKDADTLMVYMEYLAEKVSLNSRTSDLYEIMTKINAYHELSRPPYYRDLLDTDMPRWYVFYGLLASLR